MIKTYAIYNLESKCLEHINKIKLNNSKVFYKLDDNIGNIWITNSIDEAEMVRSGCVNNIKNSSENFPFNPYNPDTLKVVELSSVVSNFVDIDPCLINKKEKKINLYY